MSETEPHSNVTSLERKLDRTAKTYSNIKTLGTAVASAIGVIFAAGVYYNELTHKLEEYKSKIVTIEQELSGAIGKIEALEKQIAALEGELSKEKSAVRVSVNKAFEKLRDIQNIDHHYQNNEPPNDGGGDPAWQRLIPLILGSATCCV